MIKGSGSGYRAGSGSIPLTSGSGSGRPKNMWIRLIRIRIRIRNTCREVRCISIWFYLDIVGRVVTYYITTFRIRIRNRNPDQVPEHCSSDPLDRGMDPQIRIRIHTKMSWVRNTDLLIRYGYVPVQFYNDNVFTLGWRSLVTVFEKLKVRQFYQKKRWYSGRVG